MAKATSLDRGARDVAFAKCDFLIHDREDAAGARINRDDRSVVTAKSGYRGCANDGIIVRTIVLAGRIRERRDPAVTRRVLACVSYRRSRTWRCGQRQGKDYRQKYCESGSSELLHCFHLYRVTANRLIPWPAPNQRTTRVRVLPYAVPTVNTHSQTPFVAPTACWPPADVLQGIIASHLPINDTAHLTRLTGVASGSLAAQEKLFLSV